MEPATKSENDGAKRSKDVWKPEGYAKAWRKVIKIWANQTSALIIPTVGTDTNEKHQEKWILLTTSEWEE